jgi:hypothetical protein
MDRISQILGLSCWGQVAFAARCARRVLPLLPELWKSTRDGSMAALEASVRDAERAAPNGDYPDRGPSIDVDAEAQLDGPAATCIPTAVYGAVAAAGSALDTAKYPSAKFNRGYVLLTYESARAAVGWFDLRNRPTAEGTALQAFDEAVDRDLRLLADLRDYQQILREPVWSGPVPSGWPDDGRR